MTNAKGMPKQHGESRVKYWASIIEPDTLEQAARISRMPFVAGYVALMPDAHKGIGSAVGAVVPTEGAIIPSCVGVDLGCGMIATRTVYTQDQLPDDLSGLLRHAEQHIPAGVGKGHEIRTFDWHYGGPPIPGHFTEKQERTALSQYGTLGSGNHFAEVSVDETGQVWTVLHSGSRGIGNQLATTHIERAKGDMKRRFTFEALEDPDLAYLVEGDPLFYEYILDMRWAQDYAKWNRIAMNEALLFGLAREVTGTELPSKVAAEAITTEVINCHHNYTVREWHHGRELWITRKGAISAKAGEYGVIPGSMGTDSYIVEGLGSAASFESSSHGAGRRMSRGQARRELDVDGLKAQMGSRSWQEGDAQALLDEDPRAYKPIATVMEDQADLSRIVHTLTSVWNFKGVK